MIHPLQSTLGRIVWLQLAAFAMVLALMGVLALLLLNSASVRFENMSVRAHGETIARYLVKGVDGKLSLVLPEDQAIFYEKGLAGVAYTVTDDDDKVLFSSQPETIALLENYRHGGRTVYFQSENKRRSYLGLRLSKRMDGHQYWILITRTIRGPGLMTADVITHFFTRLGWLFIVPGVLLILVIDYLVVRHALRPVIAASRQVQTIDPTRLDVRLPTDKLPSEVLPLVEAVNSALTRVEQGFQSVRNFTADAAHELRTPLGVLRMRIDALDDRRIAATLRADVVAMSHVVDQLFEVAELEERIVPSDARADLCAVAAEVVAHVAPLAVAQQREIALEGGGSPVWVRGDTAMLFQALRNLTDNALKYTPAGSAIDVEVDSRGIVRVCDRGPGIAQAERELIFRRFWRRDRSRSNGSGLGLSIVARVAELHGGSITVHDRPGGGAIFALDLSAARLT